MNEASQKETKNGKQSSSLGWLSRNDMAYGEVISLHSLFPSNPHLAPALFLVVGPGARLVVQEWADEGRGLLVVRTQVGRQGHVGWGSSSLRVDGQL